MSIAHSRFRQLHADDRITFGRNARLVHQLANGKDMFVSVGALIRSTTLNGRNNVIAASTTLTLTEHEGRTMLLQSAVATTLTLPLATGSGSIYKFIVGQVNANGYVIKSAVGANLMKGTILQSNSGAAGATRGWTPAATDDTITLNGTTTGGAAVGDYVELQDIANNLWAVRSVVTCTGTAASPYSDTVA